MPYYVDSLLEVWNSKASIHFNATTRNDKNLEPDK